MIYWCSHRAFCSGGALMSQECSSRKTFTCSLHGGQVDEGSVQLEYLWTCIAIPYIESQQLFKVKAPGFASLGAHLHHSQISQSRLESAVCTSAFYTFKTKRVPLKSLWEGTRNKTSECNLIYLELILLSTHLHKRSSIVKAPYWSTASVPRALQYLVMLCIEWM